MAKVKEDKPKAKVGKFDLDAYKKKIKVADTPLKKDRFVELDPCMHEILGMPGLPLGHITEIYGKSDTGKCLSLNSTYVSTNTGIKRLGEALRSKDSSIEGKSVGYYLNDGIRKGKKITLSDGSFIEGTNIHKIKKINENLDLEWVKFEDLQLGEFIPTVKSEHTFNNPYDNNLAELIGWAIADASFAGKSVRFQGVLEPKLSVIRDLMVKTGTHSENNHYMYINTANTERIGLNYAAVSGTKEVPQSILESNPEAIKAFLRGLFSGDGSVDPRPAGKGIEWTTASFELAQQVQFLMKSFGINMTVKSKYVKSADKSYARCTVTGGLKGLILFQSEIGFSHPEKAEKLRSAIDLASSKSCSKFFIPYAGSLIAADYYKWSKETGKGSRFYHSELGNILSGRDKLTMERFDRIKGYEFVSEEVKSKVQALRDITFLTVAKIEDWEGEVGDPNIPSDHTYHANNLITHNTSIMFHAAAQAQAQGILPIIIVTEGKVSWDRALAMGFDRDGFAIVEEDLEYLEDVYDFMDQICASVGNGDLPHDVMIFWDSLGNTLSRDEVNIRPDGTVEKKATMMKAAKINAERLRVLSGRVNNTRKISFPKFLGVTVLNTCYVKPPAFPGGMSSEVPYGGDALWFKSSLILKTKRVKKLTATKDGVKMGFGIVSTISVEKNHLTNTSHSGEYVITGNAIIPNEKTSIDAYKEENKESWGSLELFDEDSGEVFDPALESAE